MLCEKCKERNAVYHIKQNINGKVTQINLCEHCADDMHLNPFSFDNFFSGFTPVTEERKSLKCPSCGLSYEEFKQGSKLGCKDCYDSFNKEIKRIISSIQKGVNHIGKLPKRENSHIIKDRKISKLRLGIKKAVEAEDYELAAKLKTELDEITKGDN